ncbi:zinc-binding dehydrogenase [Pedococcus sp. NPDC057267]|uniref:zinc-binding dehydrogenase n=1 Tax=Pedococcus sp. NPDC057267 TaxID=3346077 RepID=UPI00362645A6
MPTRVVVDEHFRPQIAYSSDEPLAAGQVRVRVTRTGVNFWEIMQRRGRVPHPVSGVPGSEGAGVVTEVAPGVEGLVPGSRVAWSRVPGSYSDSVVAPATALTTVPDNVDDDTAASLLFQGTTAAYLVEETWPVSDGDPVVVTAASGGVGLLLTQLLVARGARVIGVVSRRAKAEAVREAGSELVLTYSDTVASQILDAFPEGVAAVFDAVGGATAESLLSALRPRGAMVLYGSASGREAAITAQELAAGSYFLTRAAGRDYLPNSAAVQEYSRKLLDLASAGSLAARIQAVFRLHDAQDAWAALESRSTVGKVLLAP